MKIKFITFVSILLSLTVVADPAETVIAGWHQGSSFSGGKWNADIVAPGIKAQAGSVAGSLYKSPNGSNDETFGAEFAGARKGNGAIGLNVDKYVEFTVTNRGARPCRLLAFRFDAYRSYSKGIPQLVVSIVSGDKTVKDLMTVKLRARGANATVDATDFDDFDILLDDHTLAGGESVTFRIAGVGGESPIVLDNIAVTGIPASK
ncbi:MAG: hypothetical protein WC959_12050 [Kiritimatiellales bacterium]